ncbi:MAG: PilZ domain-containing protein [Myxococcota bacterium]
MVKSPAALRLVSDLPPLESDAFEERPSLLPTEDLKAKGSSLPPPITSPGIPEPTADLGIPRPSSPGAAPVILETDDISPAGDKRRARRHLLRGGAVRVTCVGAASSPVRGRVRDIAIDGGLFIELATAPELLASVRATLTLPSGHEMAFEGKVVRKTSAGVAVRLRVDQPSQAFLNVFVAVARGGDRRRALELRLEPLDSGAEADPEVALSRAFQDALLDGSDEAHQRFIQTCLTQRRIDYALTRYRAEKARRAQDPIFDAYLAQVGTILGFASLNSAEKVQPQPGPRFHRLIGVGVVILVALVGLFVLLASRR